MAITNLTGTKWEFNNNPGVFNDFGFPVGTFNINFLSNDNNYTSITGSYDFNGDYSYIQYNSTTVYNGTWTNSNYRVIEITGGTDVEDETLIAWLEANATQIIEPSGYTISFNSNGGTTISDIEEATELPTPLPTPTKSGCTFVAWYYESNFQTRAKAGDTIESNVTLYAKWHNLGSLFTEIADAIRSKDGTSENIRDVDFGERIKQIQGAKEEQTKTVSPTTSSQDVLPDANKVLSKVTVNAIPTETKSQQPNLSSGNQTINATSGKFMTSFTITKDTVNHIASNIRSGKTLYGVTGNLQPAKEEETKTVTPNFSSGNEVVTPTSGKVLSQVTINKDSNLSASNIKAGVTIFGITGTYEGESGGSGYTVNLVVHVVADLCYYSLDDGSTWTKIGYSSKELTNVTQIKFKVISEATTDGGMIATDEYFSNIIVSAGEYETNYSDNITITENKTYYCTG